MIVKVCGMRDAKNICEVEELEIEYMGFIFYPKSSRFVDITLPATRMGLHRTAVFVNETLSKMVEVAKEQNISTIQLHGTEKSEVATELKRLGYSVIKAISVATVDDLCQIENRYNMVDLFIFDTKCSGFGGSGAKFDWSILDCYKGKIPFLLSGGIGEDDADQILAFKHPSFAGVDLNSRFEIDSAFKDVEKLKKFIEKIRK